MSIITRVEIQVFTYNVANLGLAGQSAAGVGNLAYVAGSQMKQTRFAVRIRCDDGAEGAYVTHWVGTPSSLGQAQMLAPYLVGRDPEQREQIYDDLKREVRAYDHMGHGVIDIALWDLAGRKYGVSVSKMLGGFRTKLPTYASTYHGQSVPGGLDTPEAFADYALACKEQGFAGFKIHGWHEGDARKEAHNVLLVRERVGDEFKLMLDPACQLRTYLDALYVGRACDEANYFWYEDPYRDTGVAATGHQRLREQLRTPLLVSEHVRGVEQKAAFLLAGGCDMIHADPEYDLGITGAMKIAHFCEALGLDIQMHACGPAHRAVISALRNTHFYEMALMGPGMPNAVPPVYLNDYSDQPEDLASDGTVPVPSGPGLGVECQALADLLTLREAFGQLEGLRLAYVGDGNNVARSLAVVGALAGVKVVVSSPPGYQLEPVAGARLVEDPAEAVAGAHAVYTDVWVSMGDEATADERRRALAPYRIDDALLDRAAPGAIALHCLPAHPGEEITAEVLYGDRQRIWDQAENRRHAQKALLELLVS